MGSLLSAQEIIDKIDRAGNRDGIATLEDIRPHLDTAQKIPLNVTDDFHLALQSLNRICGQGADVFSMPAIFRCSAIQDGKIEPEVLKKQEDDFVLARFKRLFDNPQSDDLVRERYNEFLSFVLANHISLSALFNVLQNYPELKKLGFLENTFLGGTSASTQSETLFQFSLYAAMWHLKNNVKAFAPEELANYPDWFRKKVEGFEDGILERLEIWHISPSLGNSKGSFAYNPDSKTIVTSTANPFPPILKDLLPALWHECFHAYQFKKRKIETMWVMERDAVLVEAIALFKMLGITDPEDKRIPKLVQQISDVIQSNNPSSSEGKKEHEHLLKDFLTTYQYALVFTQSRLKNNFNGIENAVEDSEIWHVLRGMTVLGKLPDLDRVTDHRKQRELILRAREAPEQALRKIENKTYLWPPHDEKGQSISFFEMSKEMNSLLEKQDGGISMGLFSELYPYFVDIIEYANQLAFEELYDIMLSKFDVGIKVWDVVYHHEFLKTFQFLKKYKWTLMRP